MREMSIMNLGLGTLRVGRKAILIFFCEAVMVELLLVEEEWEAPTVIRAEAGREDDFFTGDREAGVACEGMPAASNRDVMIQVLS
jgi:hypothetical protein